MLGAMLIAPEALSAVLAEGLTAEHFYPPKHRHIFTAGVALNSQGRAVDTIMVADELDRLGLLGQAGGVEALHALQNNTPSISNAAQHARTVIADARYRALIHAADDVKAAAWDRDPAALDRELQRLTTATAGGYRLPSIEDVWDRLRQGENPTPTPTILARHDDTGLIHDRAAVVLFGPGGAGKTWVALRASFSGVMLGQRVAWCDLDNMGCDQLVTRLAVCGTGSAYVTSDTLAYFDGGRFDSCSALLAAVERTDPVMVVVDSLVGLLALAGAESENDNGAVRAVLQRLRDVLGRRQARTLLVIDHTGHEAGRARGASAKRDWADQCIEVVATEPLGVGQVGRLRLVSRKDRRGRFPDGTPMADVVVDATGAMPEPLAHLGHSARIALYEPSETAPGDERVTAMILDLLAKAGGEAKWSDLKKCVPLKSAHKSVQAAARDALRDDGRVKVTIGARNAMTLTLAEDSA